MKWIVRILAALALLAIALTGFGYALPVNHQASRTADFTRTREEVYALVADHKNYAAWWPELEPVNVIVIEQTPPSRFATKINEPDAAFGGTWTFEIAEIPTGSRLTITERGEIYNPIFRALARLVFGYTGTMESFLNAAQKHLAPR